MLLGDIIRSVMYWKYIDKEILGSRYEVQVDKVCLKTHKFERSTIQGQIRDNSKYITSDNEERDEVIDRVKEKYFGDSDRYIRPYSKNIETFGKYTQGDINSYSYIFYDRYENTVIGLNLEKYIIV
jgi:hypothetical protein